MKPSTNVDHNKSSDANDVELEYDDLTDEWDRELRKAMDRQIGIDSTEGRIRLKPKNAYRNRPCICGSRKKFKNCCIRKVS